MTKFNQALLGKWLQGYATKREALWRFVVEATYNSLSSGWCSKEIARPFGVGVWKHIRRGCGAFSRFIIYDVGDWSKIQFWHDIWCGDHPLKEALMELFCFFFISNVIYQKRRGTQP